MSLIIYTKTGCPWCVEALKFLNENQIEFEERDVRKDISLLKELEEKSGQNKTPTLDLNGEILADVGTDEIEIFLKEKGIIK